MKGIKITQSITNRDDMSLNLYFKDISKQPLITPEEEIELGHRIQQGDQEALDKLVLANLRFVISVAKQYQNKGIPLVDLIQLGNCGLIKGAQTWDPDKGIKFISYAVWWIRQAITYEICGRNRTIRLPMNQITYLNKINKVTEHFEQEFGRKPSLEELAKETKLPIDKISFTLSSNTKSISLETPFKDEDVGCLLDIIPNENIEDTDDALTKDDKLSKINEVLNKLSPREADVIRMSYGLGMNPMPFDEIAVRFGVGYERIRQIQKEAIEKIKIHYKNYLKELL